MSILALDAGTTGVTALAVDAGARVTARGYAEFEQHFPADGWVEHDPEQIWAAALAAVGQVLEQLAGSDPPTALGITNQRETAVLWDRETLRSPRRAIVWQDRRTAGICDQLRADGHEPLVAGLTGLRLDPYFTGTKLLWLALNEPRVWARVTQRGRRGRHRRLVPRGAAHRGPAPHHRRLERVADAAVRHPRRPLGRAARRAVRGAARRCRRWCRRTAPSRAPTRRHSSAWTCRSRGSPGTSRPPCSARPASSRARASAPTAPARSCWCTPGRAPVALRARAALHHRLAAPRTAGEYALEGAIFVTGAAIQWLRDGLGIISSAESEALARSVPDSGGVVFVPALTGLGAPDWDPHARGTILGISRGTTRAHLVRAALQAIAYEVRDVVELMTRESGVTLPELAVDGGAAGNDLLCELQATALQVPVVRAAVLDTTGLGAALLAGLGTGVWSSPQEVAAVVRRDVRFEPGARDEQDYRRWRTAVERSKGWAVL